MLRFIRRYFAIRAYARTLGFQLARRLGKKPIYTIEQVTQAVERSKLPTAFIVYAHAAYCDRNAFDAYYAPLKLKCTYDSLRAIIAKRYLRGDLSFHAETVRLRFAHIDTDVDGFEESKIGYSADEH